MRIVHVITRFIQGGAQENTFYTVRDLVRDHGDQVTLLTGPAEGPEGDLFGAAEKEGLDVRVLDRLKRSIRPADDWIAFRQIRRYLADLRPDVVHTHSSKAGILGRLAAEKENVPAIVHTIHGLPFHPYERWLVNQFYIRAERRAARATDRFITVADAMIDQAVEAGIAPRERFVTIPSGMDVDAFLQPSRPPEEVRRELGYLPGQVVVGKIARLFELKGHDDVIDAARQLVDLPQLRFLFVGGGKWRERLEAKVAAVGLAERFLFLGLVPAGQIPELLSAMDIVVHASYREGLARVLPQALLAGKPVISYNIDGAREVVFPGRTGLLVPPGDIHGLAEDLRTLAGDPLLRAQMGKTGRDFCAARFRHQDMTKAIRAVYQDVLSGNGFRQKPGRARAPAEPTKDRR